MKNILNVLISLPDSEVNIFYLFRTTFRVIKWIHEVIRRIILLFFITLITYHVYNVFIVIIIRYSNAAIIESSYCV